MPLEQRVVEPICVSRGTLPLDLQGNLGISIPNELECVTNGTLCNLIRQLSSLSRHAEDLFSGILHETTLLIARATSLQGRIERLGVKVTQLDSSVEEVSLHDIHLRKPYKANNSYDQEVVSRSTMPTSILEKYELCDKPPPLDKLNSYRDDGKDGLKYYTDPNYFFELWRQEMLRETEKEKSGKKNAHRGAGKGQTCPGGGDKSRAKKPRQPANTRERYRQMVAPQEFLDSTGKNLSNHNPYGDNNGVIYTQQYGTASQRPNSLEINQYIIDNYPYLAQHPHAPPPYYGGAVPNSHYHSGQQMQQIAQLGSPNHVGNTPPPPYNQITPQEVHNSHGHAPAPAPASGTPTKRVGNAANRPSQPPPAPPSNPPSSSSSSGGTPTVGTPSRSRGTSLNRETLPPPPPPPPPPPEAIVHENGDALDGELPLPPPQNKISPVKSAYIPNEKHANSVNAPPPPPPPPPESGFETCDANSNCNKPSTLAQEILQKQQQLRPPKLSTLNKVLPQVSEKPGDARSDLLAAIREGIKLRRVQDSKRKVEEKAAPLHDVASILARRVAMELSDSDSGGAGSDGSESDCWDDESEC